MEGSEVRKLAALEDNHWWYRERRHILKKLLEGRTPGRALDVGAAGGGNTRVLRDMGWQVSPLEYGPEGAEVAKERGLAVMRADAMQLPLPDASLDLVTAFDVLEHLEEDDRCVKEVARVLKPGGAFLVAVPADPKLWSSHDVAVSHLRRYTRETLTQVLDQPGFRLEWMKSWMVLLRPAVALRRSSSSGSDLQPMNPIVNAGLSAVVAAERYLPVSSLPGVSLFAEVRRTA
ncbi:class I SAM-dependent methyltransferase [Dermatophilus congolensis]|uniref:Probable S-adenosylmethionine-dependent methyltransferase MSMEG_2350 n=1 Tax=Dermatophilus congolensis TaxID=1863 RepID=A0A239VFS4_9MICO|nr:class I SAM-dependent methyltransferase [Dermatophilus congolensis]MBO3128906.1 class I SAM-dependent methyltransferase [Dermatophilus congolensis]MBO3132456.1 class I SAM-dependent methyltransferase [Dermatophilus congolensis]MBO3133383.1 class I SAM-dependent methyltransferase [Dermatophilus congolensis]MBO3135618.1 class I SAM-dependent methyltransferase [Dermatophilus congolensis]MBO3137857.1 class I SAM-dependent methyltransferase [Dermatophilus congolensis]